MSEKQKLIDRPMARKVIGTGVGVGLLLTAGKAIGEVNAAPNQHEVQALHEIDAHQSKYDAYPGFLVLNKGVKLHSEPLMGTDNDNVVKEVEDTMIVDTPVTADGWAIVQFGNNPDAGGEGDKAQIAADHTSWVNVEELKDQVNEQGEPYLSWVQNKALQGKDLDAHLDKHGDVYLNDGSRASVASEMTSEQAQTFLNLHVQA